MKDSSPHSEIYHIATRGAWQNAKLTGLYYPPNFEQEGFIHCATASQVDGVLQRYFADQVDLLKLVIRVDQLVHPPKFELAVSVNEEFPHIYGLINIDAVMNVIPL